MSLSLYDCSIPVFIHSLSNLNDLLEAAAQYGAEHGIEDEVLTGARLFPNMLPLTKQVQIACDIAKRGSARMAGIEPQTDEDTETTGFLLLGGATTPPKPSCIAFRMSPLSASISHANKPPKLC